MTTTAQNNQQAEWAMRLDLWSCEKHPDLLWSGAHLEDGSGLVCPPDCLGPGMPVFSSLGLVVGNKELKQILGLFMASDPSPLSEPEDTNLGEVLDTISRKRGFDDWIDAYHRIDDEGYTNWEAT